VSIRDQCSAVEDGQLRIDPEKLRSQRYLGLDLVVLGAEGFLFEFLSRAAISKGSAIPNKAADSRGRPNLGGQHQVVAAP